MLVNVADDAGTDGQPIECEAVAPDGLPCDCVAGKSAGVAKRNTPGHDTWTFPIQPGHLPRARPRGFDRSPERMHGHAVERSVRGF